MPTDWSEPAIAAMLSQLFRDIPLPIAIYDLTGEVRRVNDAQRAFGAALGDAAGVGEFNALTDLRSKRKRHRRQFLRALEGVSVDYAFEVQRGTDTPLEFHRVLMPARDESDQIVGVVSVIVDVTDWLRAERDRTRLQAQLMQTQKTESLGLMAGGIAHDFNNLLLGVLGNVSLLLEELDAGSGARRLAEAIQLSAQRAADVARQLLAYAGKGQFRVEAVDLSELVQETAEVLRITLASQSQLELSLAEHLPSVKVDLTQLRQVVMNLITNARDAVAGRGGRITVRTGQVQAAHAEFEACHGDPDPSTTDFVFVEVEDNGPGMDADAQARIFDPFYTTKAGGRGLGLSAVLGIVRGHGGALRVASTPGGGTRMRVLLPQHGRSLRPKLSSVPPVEEAQPLHAAGGHLLVVDDQDTVRSVMDRMLRAMGYGVTTVSCGADALRALESDARDARCVLLDLTMPDEDGASTFARIRALAPDLPVIFMSGYESGAVPRADGFLHKPFTMKELRAVLASVLD